MVLVKRKLAKVNEDSVSTENTVSITDHNLVQLQAQAQQKKANAKKVWDNACQEYENTIAQLLAKQAELNKQKTSQNNQNTQENNSSESINEGLNSKHIVLSEIIGLILKDLEVSYILSDNEITRIARKFNDYFNSHKDNFDIDDFRIMAKKYFLNHSKINFSQSEINLFLDSFIKEISKEKYKQFSHLFKAVKKSNYTVDLRDIENIDEFEADLADEGFDFEEDLDNEVIIINNKSSINSKKLYDLIRVHSF